MRSSPFSIPGTAWTTFVSPGTVLGILRECYAKERGYSMDLLDHLEDVSSLTITDTAYDVLGDNPLHPLTEIQWQST